jgi:FkbM family methyltransferase
LPASVLGRLRTLRARVARRRYKRRVVSHSYAGYPLQVEIRLPYGEVYDRDWPLLEEIALLRRHRLSEGARVLNLGANHGVIAMMLAKIVGPEGQVVAVEADGWLAEGAQENARLNGLDQLVCLHAAVAARDGEVAFGVHGEVDEGSGRFGRQRVPAVSIDSLSDRYGEPDVVFMDVEGYELEALHGAHRTLERRPDWFVEVHEDGLTQYGASVDALLEEFTARGYECQVAADRLGKLASGELVSLTRFGPLEDAKTLPPGRRFFLVALGGA